MEPGGFMSPSKGLSDNLYMSRINPIPRIDDYLFKIHSNIVLYLRLVLPKCLLPVKILKALLPSSILTT